MHSVVARRGFGCTCDVDRLQPVEQDDRSLEGPIQLVPDRDVVEDGVIAIAPGQVGQVVVVAALRNVGAENNVAAFMPLVVLHCHGDVRAHVMRATSALSSAFVAVVCASSRR